GGSACGAIVYSAVDVFDTEMMELRRMLEFTLSLSCRLKGPRNKASAAATFFNPASYWSGGWARTISVQFYGPRSDRR
ncbi:MAG: hypothetical protein WBY84_11370, partial [Pseudolabrys sp.]